MAGTIEVSAPPVAPPTFSLVAAARDPFAGGNRGADAAAGDRWMGGFSFRPLSCVTGGVGKMCETDNRELTDRSGRIEYVPFPVWVDVSCSTFGWNDTDWANFRAEAEQQLAAVESYFIAEEFEKGTFAKSATPDHPNRYLADDVNATVVTSAATTHAEALECLEYRLGRCNHGQRGMLHAPRDIVAEWFRLDLVRVNGNVLVTANDNYVVNDAGYAGTAPDGSARSDGSAFVYATGRVDVRRGPIQILPDSLEQAVERSMNDVALFAQRIAAATWDGCCHFAAEVDAPLCAVP